MFFLSCENVFSVLNGKNRQGPVGFRGVVVGLFHSISRFAKQMLDVKQMR